jgi:hypothetical protein
MLHTILSQLRYSACLFTIFHANFSAEPNSYKTVTIPTCCQSISHFSVIVAKPQDKAASESAGEGDKSHERSAASAPASDFQ